MNKERIRRIVRLSIEGISFVTLGIPFILLGWPTMTLVLLHDWATKDESGVLDTFVVFFVGLVLNMFYLAGLNYIYVNYYL